jgi:shikimate dehydrogenase
MKNYQLIGKDISLSLSPYIHNYIFNKYNINANYTLRNINSKESIEEVIKDIKSNKIDGINITNPYKQNIMNYIERKDSICSKIDSANCVSFHNSIINGHNTDWFGFIKMIEQNKINLKNKKIHIIGYGGASKAVVYALNEIGSLNVTIHSRTQSNNMIKKFTDIHNLIKDIEVNQAIIINASPYNFIENEYNIIDKIISRDIVWIDLLYTKLSTKYFNRFLSNEGSYFNGIDMLLYQALESINIWLRNDISNSVDFSKLKQHINEVKIA